MSKLHARRQFLRGAGGVALGLPFLPSLQGRAFAQAAPPRLPRFVAFTTPHGAVWEDDMFPPEADLVDRISHLPGHEIAKGPLVRRMDGGDAVLSPALRAPASVLSERLAKKLNVLRGLDIPFYIGHHAGGHLGNYARNDGNGTDGKVAQGSPMPTIDQVMGWSPSFYKDLNGVRARVVVTAYGGFSWGWSDPVARAGTIQEVRHVPDSKMLFEQLFVPSTTPAPPMAAPRPLLVDRVREDFKRLRNGSRRISPGDQRRLDDHVTRLFELERKIRAAAAPPVPTASCGGVARVTEDAWPLRERPADRVRAYQMYNDVVVAAFLCGTSRVATLGAYEAFAPHPGSSGDYHGIAHNWFMATQQGYVLASTRSFFQSVFLDLVRKLDVEEAPGVSVLDNALVVWTQESGMRTHDPVSIPVVTAGSAGGWLQTGLACDYRNRTQEFGGQDESGRRMHHGLGWNQWLGTCLQAMGVPRSEYGRPGMTGYGQMYVGPEYKKKYLEGVFARADEPLPFLKA